MPSRCEPPLSRLDLLLAHPFLTAMRESLETPPAAARPGAPAPPVAGAPGPISAHPGAPLPQAGLRARFMCMCRALRQSFAALHCPPEPVQSEDELETVLMFSLTGLALSLYLAPQIPMTGDGLIGILTLLS